MILRGVPVPNDKFGAVFIFWFILLVAEIIIVDKEVISRIVATRED